MGTKTGFESDDN